jgi:death-on-curing protein
MLDAIHDAQLREHGGSPGIRDDGLLESALARPVHKFMYETNVDVARLAAAYTFGLARNHGFVDGNKRTAFMSAYVFLRLNQQELDAGEPDVVSTIEGVAAGRLTESALANWIRDRLRSA